MDPREIVLGFDRAPAVRKDHERERPGGHRLLGPEDDDVIGAFAGGVLADAGMGVVGTTRTGRGLAGRGGFAGHDRRPRQQEEQEKEAEGGWAHGCITTPRRSTPGDGYRVFEPARRRAGAFFAGAVTMNGV